MKNGHDCQAFYMKVDCAATCGYCGTDMLEKINNSVILKACKKKQKKNAGTTSRRHPFARRH